MAKKKKKHDEVTEEITDMLDLEDLDLELEDEDFEEEEEDALDEKTVELDLNEDGSPKAEKAPKKAKKKSAPKKKKAAKTKKKEEKSAFDLSADDEDDVLEAKEVEKKEKKEKEAAPKKKKAAAKKEKKKAAPKEETGEIELKEEKKEAPKKSTKKEKAPKDFPEAIDASMDSMASHWGKVQQSSDAISKNLERVSAMLQELPESYDKMLDKMAHRHTPKASKDSRITLVASIGAIVLSVISLLFSQSVRENAINQSPTAHVQRTQPVATRGSSDLSRFQKDIKVSKKKRRKKRRSRRRR